MCMNAITTSVRRKKSAAPYNVAEAIRTQSNESSVLSKSEKSGFQYPVDNFYCNCLVLSSSFFFIPAVRAYSCNTSILGVMTFLTALFSANFWWFGVPNWRLVCDKIFAYSTSIIYVVTGLSHIINADIKGNYSLLIGYAIMSSLGLLAVVAYNMSCYKWNNGCTSWVFYHMGFHVLLTIGKYLLIEVTSDTCSAL